MGEQKLSFLLVEDDDVDILSIKRAFQKNAINSPIYIARDGLEALTLLRGTNGSQRLVPLPLIVLLDINLPKMNGIEFLKELRLDPDLKSTPVIVFTTSNEERDVKAAYNYNVAGYLLKSCEEENFAETLETVYRYWHFSQLPAH